MDDLPTRRSTADKLRAEARRLDLPEQIVRALPPIVALFSAAGLPAAGIAMLSALGLGEAGRRKMREFSWAVEAELGVVEGRLLAKVAAAEASTEELNQRIEDLYERLDDSRVEQLGRLFEEYMRGTDGEWLDWLRNAAREVCRPGDDVERGLVIAGLRTMTPAHVRELLLVSRGGAFVVGNDVEDGGEASGSHPACHAALLAAGLLEDEVVLRGKPMKELRITPLGLAALRFLGISD